MFNALIEVIILTEFEDAAKFGGDCKKSITSWLYMLCGIFNVGHGVCIVSLKEKGEKAVVIFSSCFCVLDRASVASIIRFCVQIWTFTVLVVEGLIEDNFSLIRERVRAYCMLKKVIVMSKFALHLYRFFFYFSLFLCFSLFFVSFAITCTEIAP
jgi:hypothetical protein